MPQLLKILELQDTAGDVLATRLPPDGDAVIEWGSQLIVRESQIALFLKDGQLVATFEPGRHTLTTQNIPVLTKFATGLVFGSGNTPFKAEVYFIGRHLFRDLRWGTPEPIYIPDPILTQVPIRAHGRFAVQISDPGRFCATLVGTRNVVRTADVEDYLRSQYLVSALTSGVASLGKPFVELARHLRELGTSVKSILTPDFAALGLTLAELSVNSITPTEEISAMLSDGSKQTSAAYAKARGTQMELEAKAAGAAALRDAGTNYKDVGTTDALKTMAEKGGGGSGGGGDNPLAAGMNFGASLAAAQMMRDTLAPNSMSAGHGSPSPAAIQSTAHSPAATPAPVGDPVTRLKQLKELLDLGAITQAEFDAKKADILKVL